MANPVPSPCINVCKLDANNVCRGCFRTLEEIMAWRDADDERRRAILDNIEQRKPR